MYHFCDNCIAKIEETEEVAEPEPIAEVAEAES